MNDLESLLDGALSRPREARGSFLREVCREDPALRARVERLLELAERPDGFLERPPVVFTSEDREAVTPLATLGGGERVGAFQIVRRLGTGGMGEVWLAERVEGGFNQQVAIKCLRDDSPSLLARFEIERSILASLEHPGIARLYDGGVTADGRPYMVLECVEGEDLLTWARRTRADLSERLSLFLQVCDAVAYAHTQLVIHRDIKPANILVTAEGRAKLLDFGIARLLDPETVGDATVTGHLSPAYAAPEQLTGGRISTATDVHALGATLYQLLTGVLPWEVGGLPLATAIQRLITIEPRPASEATRGDHAVPARLLSGDLDAILRKALRPEPHARYADARALADDVRRCLRHEAVEARSGAWTYVTQRFIRRHWRPLAAAGLLFAALTSGLFGIAWQARRAEEQAARATVIKDYLVQVFAASDPRIASDRPRGQITARELLEIGVARIDEEFAGRPDLQIELLDLTASIYRELGELDRYATLHQRFMDLARAHFGNAHPTIIGGLLRESDDAVLRHDYEGALRLVEEVDVLIRRAGLDESSIRGEWWLRKGNALEADASRWDERVAAFSEAVRLFELRNTRDRSYAAALGGLGAAYWERDTRDATLRSREWFLRAIAAAEQARTRDDGELQVLYANLGQVQTWLGDAAGADAAFARSTVLAQKTYGEANRRYWHAAAAWAGALHGRGERDRALSLVAKVEQLLPAHPSIEDQDIVAMVQTIHGELLVRDGRPGEAIPLLEAAERGYLRANRGYRLAFLRRMLGEAYEGVGRFGEARRQFELALEELTAENPPDSLGVLAGRERLGRSLLVQGELAEAETALREVISLVGEATVLPVALAWSGVAQLAIIRGDARQAMHAASRAIEVFENIEGAQNMRQAPDLWLIRARALALAGEVDQARDWANRALAAYRRHTHPESAQIAAATAVLTHIPER